MSSAFESHFEKVYGVRWARLRAAMTEEPKRETQNLFGGYSQYVMDGASVRAARALQVRPQDRVLDLCAAPGGKSLLLLAAAPSQLVSNEMSLARRKRLEEVIRTHVPADQWPRVKITGFDGNRFGLKTPNEFDRVLLDAPCSSERHLIEQNKLSDWTESRTKQLGKRQYSLLCAAILATKPGGTLVYSTCSISPLENDEVIKRVLERKSDQVALDPEVQDLVDLENTAYGFQILPDRSQGQGPMYIARLVKR